MVAVCTFEDSTPTGGEDLAEVATRGTVERREEGVEILFMTRTETHRALNKFGIGRVPFCVVIGADGDVLFKGQFSEFAKDADRWSRVALATANRR